MTALLQRVSPTPAIPAPESVNRVVLHDVDWPAYRAIADALPERRVRLTYDRGALEIMTVSSKHERFKSLIGVLVIVLADVFQREIASFGSFTHRRADLLRALEPDACFYTLNFPAIRGKTVIDLEIDPPPDLVLEVEISRSVLDRLAIFQSLRVGEIWRADQQRVHVLVLKAGQYREVDRSPTFPEVPLEQISRFLAVGIERGELAMIQAVRAWFRKQPKKAARRKRA
jgi:Uma2 family endonuclease